MSNILKFCSLVGQLKRTKRTGWVNHDVNAPESVSDHMYRMAIVSFLLPSDAKDKDGKTLDRDHCIKLALVHDMAECIVGDLAPSDGVSKEEKHAREKGAMKELADLAGGEIGKEFYELWEEYEEQRTSEANFVKDLDRFEMILQAHEYEKEENRTGWLQDFFNSTSGKFQHPVVKGWVEELYKLRESQRK